MNENTQKPVKEGAAIFLRLIMGLVFMFSGFVKAVDPLGSCYKFTDYFNLVFGMPNLATFSLAFAVILSALEFTTGVMLFFKLKPQWAIWMSFAFMLFFTPLTLYIAITDAVHDCGCFGDFLKLTNWETFGKNVVLLALAILLVCFRKRFDNPLSDNAELGISIAVFCIALIFQHIMLRHLPIFDFRPYKIGNNIAELKKMPADAPHDVYETILVYENKETGKVKEFTSENYPWDDSTWVWKDTKSVRVKEGYQPPVHDFTITDTAGVDIADQVLQREKPVLLVITHNLAKSDVDGLDMLRKLQDYADKKDYDILGLTSSNWDEIEEKRNEFSIDFPYYQTDDITLKTMIRANPGIMLLEKGIVIDKWNFRDFKFDK